VKPSCMQNSRATNRIRETPNTGRRVNPTLLIEVRYFAKSFEGGKR
jgi:hypothetical protein